MYDSAPAHEPEPAASPPPIEERTTPLPRISTSTRGYQVKDQVELWRDQLSGFTDVMPPTRDAADFTVETTAWRLGPLVVTDSRLPARRQERSAHKIRTHQVDQYRLLLQKRGTLKLDADGRRVIVQPGQVVLSDMARPETCEADDGETVIVFVEREALDEVLPGRVDINGLVPQGAIGAMLAATLKAAARHVADLGAPAAPSIASAILQMAVAAVAGSTGQSFAPVPPAEGTLLRRACRYIDAHVMDTSLGAASLCAALNVSRATLYRVFEPVGGVASHVREQRLLRIHDLLAAPTGRLHLGRVAEDFGFKSQAHFSQLFRDRFGYPPSKVPADAPRPLSTSNGVPNADPDAAASLAQWVLSLRR
jgi:AraC-like DNA-binding protein